MDCPQCIHKITYVIDSREYDNGDAIKRRRECEKCKFRFNTFERIETKNLIVIKKDGTRETYDRDKLKSGIWKACEKRKVTENDINNLINTLEEQWGKSGNEIASVDIGENVMDNLKQLDEVAYIRFASVYRQFKDVETFKKELQKLLEE